MAPMIEMHTRSSESEKPALPTRCGRSTMRVIVTGQGSNFRATARLGSAGGQPWEMAGEDPAASAEVCYRSVRSRVSGPDTVSGGRRGLGRGQPHDQPV